MATQAVSFKAFILCLLDDTTICAIQVKRHVVYFVQDDQHGIMAGTYFKKKFYFNVTFSLQLPW